MSTMDKELRVGMVGYAFMGAAHSQAWRTVNRAFDLPLSAQMTVVCGRNSESVAAAEHGEVRLQRQVEEPPGRPPRLGVRRTHEGVADHADAQRRGCGHDSKPRGR